MERTKTTRPLAIILTTLLLFMTGTVFAQARDQSTSGWPPTNVLTEYGIAGMSQPIGATEVWWRIMQDGYGGSGFFNVPVLYISLKATTSTEQAVKNWFNSNGWTSYSDGSRSMPRYTKSNARAGHDFSNIADGASNIIIAGVIKGIAWPNSAVWGRFSLSGVTLPSGSLILEVEDDDSLYITITGGNTAYNNLVSQFTAKMGKGQDFEGDLAFWDSKTSVMVLLNSDGEEVYITVEKR